VNLHSLFLDLTIKNTEGKCLQSMEKIGDTFCQIHIPKEVLFEIIQKKHPFSEVLLIWFKLD
ncbi:MAG TPA: hypothetical protein DEV63_03675, partial [Algoriphagus sp.]|nr:hypothetical protein [Algoriphagus sp.]